MYVISYICARAGMSKCLLRYFMNKYDFIDCNVLLSTSDTFPI